VTLTLTSDDLKSHIIVNVLTLFGLWLHCFIVGVQTDILTDGHFYRVCRDDLKMQTMASSQLWQILRQTKPHQK